MTAARDADEDRRAEQAAWEALAATDELRRRSLTDAARSLVHRGDRVAVSAEGTTWTGVLVHAAGDLACLRAPSCQVDVRLGAPWVLRVLATARDGGASPGGASSFRARLAEHEASGAWIELVGSALTGDLAGLHAVIVAVATDHLVVRDADASTCVVPLEGVTAAVTRP